MRKWNKFNYNPDDYGSEIFSLEFNMKRSQRLSILIFFSSNNNKKFLKNQIKSHKLWDKNTIDSFSIKFIIKYTHATSPKQNAT